MVLIYDRMTDDPRVKRLSAAAAVTWLAALSTCNTHGRETIAIAELEVMLEPRRAAGHISDLEEMLDEMVASELLVRLPHDHLRLLARLDLWAYDEEEGPGF